jgi:hypothetical protein
VQWGVLEFERQASADMQSKITPNGHNKCRKLSGSCNCCRCCAHLHPLDVLLLNHKAIDYRPLPAEMRSINSIKQAQTRAQTHPPRCVNLMATFSPVLLSNASCKKVRPLWFKVRMLVYLGLPPRGSWPHWPSMLLCLLLGSRDSSCKYMWMNCSGC